MSKISIILPTYNVGQYIVRCIESCIQQTYQDFELIVVDDCGGDDSIEQVKRFQKQGVRIELIHNEKNLGTFHARKKGVEAATGDYILFLDPDDELELDAIETLSEITKLKNDIIFYGSRREPEPKRLKSRATVPSLSSISDKESLIEAIFSCKKLGYGTEGKLIKKSVLEQAYKTIGDCDGQRLTYGEDVLLFFGILICIETAISIKNRLYIYHFNNTSITATQNDSVVNAIIKQLDFLIAKVDGFKVQSPLDTVIKDNFVRRLELMKLLMMKKNTKGFPGVLEVYFNLLLKSGSLKYLIKIMIYSASFGRVKL